MNPRDKFPKWVGVPLWGYADKVGEIENAYKVARIGTSMLHGVGGGIAAVLRTMPESMYLGGPDAEDKLKNTEELSKLAQREVENDFQVLNSQALLAHWASLESFIKSFVASLLENEPRAREADGIRKLQVRLGEYLALEERDRYVYIAELLDRETGNPLRAGVTRFEDLLGVFGLSGQVEENVRKTLFELNNVRNVIVHKGGIADRRLVEACPWLGLNQGDVVKVRSADLSRYSLACVSYVTGLLRRLGEYWGIPKGPS